MLLPDEILRMDHRDLLIVLRGHNVLKARKFDYTCHPLARQITPESVRAYRPLRPADPLDPQDACRPEMPRPPTPGGPPEEEDGDIDPFA